MSLRKPRVELLVLDAGPLLSLAPLRGLAERYFTVPQVVGELRDKHAREHFEKLSLAGVEVKVANPDLAAVAHVTELSKKTGDFSALSQADIYVLALTYSLQLSRQKETDLETVALPVSQPQNTQPPSLHTRSQATKSSSSHEPEDCSVDSPIPTSSVLEAEDEDADEDEEKESSLPPQSTPSESASEDDGEGEWITPANVTLHKSQALNLLPSSAGQGSEDGSQLQVACMTADFAMQNVLLQMRLGLVDVNGRRIAMVKSWVLRCHACFKLCRDMNKKFCPTCGNPSLLRTSVSVATPSDGSAPVLKVHLKKNFQYRTRGTIYSIPSPKPGSSKTGAGEGLILREDQTGWIRAEKRDQNRRQREDKKLVEAVRNAKEGEKPKIGSWMDPEWVPEMLMAGSTGKGRHIGTEMPSVGFGRRNPNEKRRKRK